MREETQQVVSHTSRLQSLMWTVREGGKGGQEVKPDGVLAEGTRSTRRGHGFTSGPAVPTRPCLPRLVSGEPPDHFLGHARGSGVCGWPASGHR